MATPEHVEMLKRSVEEWNAWRDEHPDERPDLSEANLREADLHVANLQGADLQGADLHGADLHGVDLSYAKLSHANLSHGLPRWVKHKHRVSLVTAFRKRDFRFRFDVRPESHESQ